MKKTLFAACLGLPMLLTAQTVNFPNPLPNLDVVEEVVLESFKTSCYNTEDETTYASLSNFKNADNSESTEIENAFVSSKTSQIKGCGEESKYLQNELDLLSYDDFFIS